MNRVLYLYGFVPPDAALPANGLAGIADAAVELLPLNGVAAAVSRLPADEYAVEAIEPHFADLQWVAEHGVQHERVVAWFVDHAQILPVRLFTLYTSEETLAAEARARSALLQEQMQRFRGLREWDVKVSYRADVVAEHLGEVSAEIAELDRELAAAAPGKRYLLQKKRADLARVETARAARRLAQELLETLRAHAQDSALSPIPADAAELPVVANAALLVAAEREGALRADVQQRAASLRPLGLEVLFSGPWAPYRFMASEDAGRAAAADV